MRLLIVADVAVPDSVFQKGAQPEAIAELAKFHGERSVRQMWPGWDSNVEATVSMVPDGPKLEGGR